MHIRKTLVPFFFAHLFLSAWPFEWYCQDIRHHTEFCVMAHSRIPLIPGLERIESFGKGSFYTKHGMASKGISFIASKDTSSQRVSSSNIDKRIKGARERVIVQMGEDIRIANAPNTQNGYLLADLSVKETILVLIIVLLSLRKKGNVYSSL